MQNVPWNKGRLTGQKRPLKPKDVWAIRVRRRRGLAVAGEGVATGHARTGKRMLAAKALGKPRYDVAHVVSL